MSTTYRVYRSGTLVTTFVDADDAGYSVSPDTTGWTPGTYPITITGQLAGWAESDPVACGNETMNAAGPAHDTGDTFPVIATAASGATTGAFLSVSTRAFSVAGPCLVVVRVSYVATRGAQWLPCTVSWVGGTPTGASAFTNQVDATQGTYGNHHSSIWTATVSQAFSSKSIQVAGSLASLRAALSVAVDALTGVNASPIGVSTTLLRNNSLGVLNATLAGVTAGSWVMVAGEGESATSMTPVAGTTEDLDTVNSDANDGCSAAGRNVVGAGGSVNAGWSTQQQYGSLALLEIKKA